MATLVSNPDDLLNMAGRDLGVTSWVGVDQNAIDTFAQVTLDQQWIHIDPERSASGPFGVTIAHGFFTLSLCSHFFGELLTVHNVAMVINYGLDRVRFPSPLTVGSRVRAHGALQEAAARADAVQTVTRLTVQAEGAEKPTCVADLVSRFYPRGSE
ncbi:MAG: MaoC family dehydratase [Micromonosporaceae bacterium]